MTHKTKNQIDMKSKCVAIYLCKYAGGRCAQLSTFVGFLKSVIMADICKVKESFQEDYHLDYMY